MGHVGGDLGEVGTASGHVDSGDVEEAGDVVAARGSAGVEGEDVCGDVDCEGDVVLGVSAGGGLWEEEEGEEDFDSGDLCQVFWR